MKNWLNSIYARLALVLTIAVVMGVTIVQPVHAAEIIKDGSVGKDEVINDDVFLTGNENVVVDGTINGMLFTAGRTVIINGTVNGDVLAFGSVITVSETGKVTGNMFLGAQTLDLAGQVTGSVFGGSAAMNVKNASSVGNNLYYGGFSLEAAKGSKVGKDLFAGVYQAILNGDITRDARVAGGAVEVRGSIGRNANFQVEAPGGEEPQIFMPPNSGPALPPTIKSGLRIDPNAKIGGKLTYTSQVAQANAIQAAPSGGIVYMTPVPSEKNEKPESAAAKTATAWGLGVLDLLRNMATLLILGALALWLIPDFYQKTVEQARTRTLPAAGVGFLSILAGYTGAFLAVIVLLAIIIFLSIITLGGLSGALFGIGFASLGVVIAAFTLMVSYGSKLVIAFLVGQWVMSKLAPTAGGQRVWGLVIGVALYAILRAVPVLGWVIGVVVTLVGLGAIYFTVRALMKPAAAPAVIETQVV